MPNIGTKWHYSFKNYLGNEINRKIEYVSDSISTITGEKIKKLLTTKLYYNLSGSNQNVFIKQKNDSVWFKHFQTGNSWQLLYDFNATASQSWTYSVLSGTFVNTHTVTVNSVGTITLNSQSLKALYVTCNYGPFTYTATICERMGCMGFLFNSVAYVPQVVIDGDFQGIFLCYEDSTFGLKQFTNKPCNYSSYVGLREDGSAQALLNIYPNPTNGILNIELENVNAISTSSITNLHLKITNTLGQIVLEAKLEKTLNISSLNNGIYFLQLFDKGNLIGTEKILKE